MLNNKTLWWGLLIAWIAGSSYWHVCKIKLLCGTDLISSSASADAIVSDKPLVISDTSSLLLKSKGNFTFAKSGVVANKSGVNPEMDSLALYLASNPRKSLIITGQYSAQESNSTTFPDLGLARASEIKNWLLGKGLPDSTISINSRINEKLNFSNDSLNGGIAFTFVNAPARNELELAVDQRFESIFKPLELYFSPASSNYIKTRYNRQFVLEAKKYLNLPGEKRLILTGHTDEEDSAELNLALSKKRAKVIKAQLVALGIPADRIIAIGRGETEPKVPNSTPAGKRANRRVTMVIK